MSRSSNVPLKATEMRSSLHEWLKAQNVCTNCDITNQDAPESVKHAVAFLESLRTSGRYPGRLLAEEVQALKVIRELTEKIDYPPSECGDEASPLKQSQGKKTPPLTKALQKLKIQEKKGCVCKGNCKTRSCGCRKMTLFCSSTCKCGSLCVNKTVVSSEPDKEDYLGDDIDKENINWNLHIASLVKCEKCKRSFFPNRVVFHSKVCKEL